MTRLRICRHPGCSKAVESGYCARHHKPETDRPNAAARGYGHKWRKFRNWYLGRHPLCVIKEKCNGTPATEIDHITPLSKGGPKYDEDNCQAACKPCHSWKTAVVDKSFQH